MKRILLLKGKAKDVFAMLDLLTTTTPLEEGKEYWQLRATIIDIGYDLRPSQPLSLRRN